MSKKKNLKLSPRQMKTLQTILAIQSNAIEHSLEATLEATKEMYALKMITELILKNKL